MLILAGAGSGKGASYLPHRLSYRESWGHGRLHPGDDHTSKAAQEMVERVDKLVGSFPVAKPTISTFHSFCVRVLTGY